MATSGKLHIFMPKILVENGTEYFMINTDIANRMNGLSKSGRFEAFLDAHHALVEKIGIEPPEDIIKQSIDYLMKNNREMDVLVILVPSNFHGMIKRHIQSHYFTSVKFKDVGDTKMKFARFWQTDDWCHVRFSKSIEVMLAHASKAK